eukprot:11393881-Prorocentrum_lima.AAC.1
MGLSAEVKEPVLGLEEDLKDILRLVFIEQLPMAKLCIGTLSFAVYCRGGRHRSVAVADLQR